jgi:hypothetical protein
MDLDLLRVAAEQGLLLAGRAGHQPGWRTTCRRCTGWLELPPRPADPVWWLRRMYAFASRHRHRGAS